MILRISVIKHHTCRSVHLIFKRGCCVKQYQIGVGTLSDPNASRAPIGRYVNIYHQATQAISSFVKVNIHLQLSFNTKLIFLSSTIVLTRPLNF